MNLSAVVLTKNEEKNIERCLKSLWWCGEIVVIDDGSLDRTVSIARKLGAKVYKRNLNNDFSKQRNFGLSYAKRDWVLFVDADEVIGEDLRKEIEEKTRNTWLDGFYIERQYFFMGCKISHGEVGNTWLLRLGRRGKGKWERAVHEEWRIKGRVGKMEGKILHYPQKTLFDFLGDINRYSEIHALENEKEGKKPSFFIVVFYPPAKFFVNYILRGGFLDGTAGFVLAVFMSFHSFLSWSRLWLTFQK